MASQTMGKGRDIKVATFVAIAMKKREAIENEASCCMLWLLIEQRDEASCCYCYYCLLNMDTKHRGGDKVGGCCSCCYFYLSEMVAMVVDKNGGRRGGPEKGETTRAKVIAKKAARAEGTVN